MFSRWLIAAVLFGVVTSACSQGEENTPAEGFEIDDRYDVIESGVYFSAWDLPSLASLHPDLETHGIVVQQPGELGYDAVVVYRAGPCGNPKVEVGQAEKVRVWVTPRKSGDCDASLDDFAIGLQIEPEHDEREVTGHWG